MTYKREGDELLVVWNDKRVINMLSTVDSAGMVETRDKQDKIKLKPECIVRYNSHLHGVDMVDQYLVLYPFTRKAIKWPKKLFFYLIQCTLFNAFMLHKKRKRPTDKIVDFLAFMKNATRILLQNEDENACASSPASLVTSSHSTRPSFSTKVGPPRRVPSMVSPYRLHGKKKDHVLHHFPPTTKDKTPTRR
ncbi:hypothetical protein C0J52_21344 [Blattella germanica]|nr:hypothetical protein C0J52_21344 [Blattella germanica]